MSRVEDLLAVLAPNGVEHRPLGELGEFIRGNGLQKSDLTAQGVPAIHYGEVHTKYGVWTDHTKSFTTPEKAAKLRRARPGDLVIATTSEDDAAVAKATAWVGSDETAVSGDAYIYRHSLDPKFVAYFFQSTAFQSAKKQYITGTKVRRVSGDSLAKIFIPLPPLAIQDEIVRILDSFAQLEAELEAELEARKAQYLYYCNHMFTKGGWPQVRLEDLAQLKYGLTASGAGCGTHRLIRITDIDPSGKLAIDGAKFTSITPEAEDYVLKPGDILVARTGATYAKTMLFNSPDPSVHASFLIRLRFNDQVLPAYYWHYTRSLGYWHQASSLMSSGGQPQFNGNALSQIKLPLAPLPQQQLVVATLDRLDSISTSLQVGLPAEISIRQGQYEYYRDKLLTFKELG